MKTSDKLRRALLRWDQLLTLLVLGLPFLVLMLLGFVWLLQNGALLWFLSISLVVGLTMLGVQRVLRKRWRNKTESSVDVEDQSVEPNPDWLPREKQVFEEVSSHITSLTRQAQPWESLPEHALDVVNRVAAGLGGEGKTALNFTLPEALLLIETTAERYRDHLRTRIPFSDQVSLSTMYWLWRQRNRANLMWKLARGSGRLARIAINPTAGVLRELEQIVAGGNSSYLTDHMMGVMQSILLEEVAYAAVELYSGRLRFSDAELLHIQLATATEDRDRLAQPDTPLRILFVGQISAGKSTLINALLSANRAETDAAPTTPGLITYEMELDGIPCHVLDSQGLDGSKRSLETMLTEMTQADLIVWTVRANRSARAVDRALKQQFDAWFEAHPQRRKPVVILVATAMDQLTDDWPHTEGEVPEAVQQRFASGVRAIADDMEGLRPLPVSATPVPWNLDAVISAMSTALAESLLVQRNRRRVEGAGRERSLRAQARKGRRGVQQGIKLVGSRFTRKVSEQKPEGDRQD